MSLRCQRLCAQAARWMQDHQRAQLSIRISAQHEPRPWHPLKGRTLKSDRDVRVVVERCRWWIDRLTLAESLLIPAVPAALIWAITADQQARETALHPFQIPWSDYGAEAWTAMAVWFGLWVALIAVFAVRDWLMGKLVAITQGHRMEAASKIITYDSAYRRGRMMCYLGGAPLALWFLSVIALPIPAVWQIGALLVGAWLSCAWQAVEKVEASSLQRMYESAREAAQETWVRKMFGD